MNDLPSINDGKTADGKFAVGNHFGQGRPLGSRNKLSEKFVEMLAADFAEHGEVAVQKVREDDPAAYLRVVASLVPKQLDIDTRPPVTFTMVLHDDKPLKDNDSANVSEAEILPKRPTQAIAALDKPTTPKD